MTKVKPSLEFLEVMAINACNLSCQGCTTFSDLTHRGYVTWEQGQSWLQLWVNRVDIQAIGVIGGEPLINPEITQWIQGMRSILPNAQIRFVTNGLLLERRWEVVDLLESVGNAVLKISHHVATPQMDQVIQRLMQCRDWTPITEYGIDRWCAPSGLRLQISRPTVFFKTFKNDYANMMPHSNHASDAFAICVQQRCPMLYKGKIWKCGTLALTPEILERMHHPNSTEWEPWINSGLTAECSDLDLTSFVNNFGKPHKLCGQCPSSQDLESHLDHTNTVTIK